MIGHAHRWVLDEAIGEPTVTGRCRECGESRQFHLSHPRDQLTVKAKWGGDDYKRRARQRGTT